jgi:hypothetical protein
MERVLLSMLADEGRCLLLADRPQFGWMARYSGGGWAQGRPWT